MIEDILHAGDTHFAFNEGLALGIAVKYNCILNSSNTCYKILIAYGVQSYVLCRQALDSPKFFANVSTALLAKPFYFQGFYYTIVYRPDYVVTYIFITISLGVGQAHDY